MGFDIVSDFSKGLSFRHLAIECLIVLGAGTGMSLLLLHYFQVTSSLDFSQTLLHKTLAENQKWKQESEKYLTQLSHILDRQFQEWGLSDAEKEVAHLLLKGYSVKVIAEKRFVVEKTIRTQFSSIYSKSGLASRTEFVSFFLPLFFS